MKYLKLLLLFLLPTFAISQNIDTINVIEGVNIVVDKDKVGNQELEQIGVDIDKTVEEVKEIVKDVEEPPRTIADWIQLLFLFAPVLTSLVTRATRVVNTFKQFFSNIDTLPIVIIVGTVIAGVMEYLQSGISDFSFQDWGGLAAITIAGAIFFYESTKNIFGRTPKKEE